MIRRLGNRQIRAIGAIALALLILTIGFLCLQSRSSTEKASAIASPLNSIHRLEASLQSAILPDDAVSSRNYHEMNGPRDAQLVDVIDYVEAINRDLMLSGVLDGTRYANAADTLLSEIRADIKSIRMTLSKADPSEIKAAASEVMDDIRDLELILYQFQATAQHTATTLAWLILAASISALFLLAHLYFAGRQEFRHHRARRTHLTRKLIETRRHNAEIDMQLALDTGALNLVSDAVEVFDGSGRLVYVNEAACAQTGYSREELLDMHLWDIAPTREAHKWNMLWDSIKTDRYRTVQSSHRRKSGEVFPVEVHVRHFKHGDRELMLSVVSDTTRLEFARANLEESRRLYRELHESIDVGIGLVDSDERFVFANRNAHRIFGVPEDSLRGRTLREFLSIEEFAKCQMQTANREQGQSATYELEITRPTGEKRLIALTAKPRMIDGSHFIGTFGVFRDVTEERRLEAEHVVMEERLNRAAKMEAIGLLAGGVAHDLNNMLSPLVGYPEMILRKLPPDSPVRKWVEKIEKAAEQAADVISDLLTMARRGRYQMKPTSVNDVLKEYIDSPGFARTLSRNPGVAFTSNLDESLGRISGSGAHLAKVFMNVITNALEATSAGGSVSISTFQCCLTRLHSGFESIVPGEYAAVKVVDTGMGISREDISKIFEPYFSKKKMGASGSGLGLAVVYGVMKDHGGYYDIISEVGKGTVFLLYFPVEQTKHQSQDFRSTIDLKGKHAVIISDDLEVQEMTGLMLEALGLTYQVCVYVANEQCLQDGSFDIAIIDVPSEKYTHIESNLAKLRANGILRPAICLVDRLEGSDRDFMPSAVPVFPVRKPAKSSVLGEAIQSLLASAHANTQTQEQSRRPESVGVIS